MTGAANFLHLTQPTLSRQIGELEEKLGTRLFVRHSHSVSLTPDGARLRKRATEILDMIERTEVEFTSKSTSIGGEIHIGAGETRVMRFVAGIIREIREEYPDIRIHLHSGNLDDVTERLDRGLLDFGVLIQPANLEKYGHISLPEKDSWGLITRKDGKLASLSAITRQDLLDEPLILSRQAIRQTSVRNEFVEWFEDDFEKLHVVATFNLVYNAALLAESGIGHVVSIGGLVDISENSKLCFRPLSPRLETGLSIVWKKSRYFSPAAEVFFRRIRKQLSIDTDGNSSFVD